MAHAQQERYSEFVDLKLRDLLATKDGYIFNTRYEGDPKAGAVNIPVRDTEVSVRDYDKASGIALETGTTTYLTVTIDQEKAINELIDGYDAAAVPDGIVAERLDSGAYGLADAIDEHAISILESEGTTSTDTTQLTDATVYDSIVDARTELSNNKVPNSMRWLIVSPEVYGLLLKDTTNFIRQSDISQELVYDGAIGQIAGFTVYESTNLDANTEYIAGHPDWCHRVEEWSVDVKLQDLDASGTYIGASAVQGRKAYTHKVSKAAAVYVKTYV